MRLGFIGKIDVYLEDEPRGTHGWNRTSINLEELSEFFKMKGWKLLDAHFDEMDQAKP